MIPATVYSKYYALAVVGNEHGEGDFWWGLSVTISMVIVALASPPLGAIADHAGVRKRFLGLLTYLSVGATALMATVEAGRRRVGPRARRRRDGGVRGRHRLLQRVPPRPGRRDRGGAGSPPTGSPRATRARRSPWPPPCPSRSRGSYGGAFLTAAALFGLFALPAMLFLPPDRPGGLPIGQAVRVGFTETRENLRRILRLPELRGFLLAYLFFEDGTNTVVYFSAVFAGHTLGFTTAEVIGLYFVVQISALAGRLALGPADRHVGPEGRGDDDPRPVVPGRRWRRTSSRPRASSTGSPSSREPGSAPSRPPPAPSWRA